MKFASLEIDERVMAGISDAGFTDCTPVQERTFRYTMEGRDVLVQSQTGTGKTAAFLITIFQNFLSREDKELSLVVVPTRELAVQIEEEARLLGGHTGLRIASIYGGVAYKNQEEALARGVDLLVGTPGRLLDFAKSRKIRFEKVRTCVIDEADRMFDMGFYPDIREIMRKLPPRQIRQTMLFSATLGTRVRNLAWEYMNAPGEIEISPENVTVEFITQELYHTPKSEKLKLLLGILKRGKPENCLIFVNTKYMAMELAWRLTENGYKCRYLMGDLPQRKRLQIIGKFKTGEIPFLVATDVAARGLHIEDLDMVVNYDIPEDFENYVHRIGRTARAGKRGKAITLACEKYVYGLEAIEEFIKQKIPTIWPGEELFEQDITAGKPFHSPDKDYIRYSSDRDGRRNRNRRGKPPGEIRPPRNRERSSRKPKGPRTPLSFKARSVEVPPRQEILQHPKSPPKETAQRPQANSSEEERLVYYRRKYGEDFKLADGGSSPKRKGRGSRQAPGNGETPSRHKKKKKSPIAIP